MPVDFTPGTAARLDATAPEVLFAAFLFDAGRRARAAARHGFAPSRLDAWLANAAARWREDERRWAMGQELLAELGIGASAETTNGSTARAERPEG